MGVLLVALFVCCQIICGYEGDNVWTNGLVNGRWWTTLSSASKLTYVIGISEGLALFATETIAAKPSDAPRISKLWASLTSKGILPGELVKEIDRFYSRGDNLGIPLNAGYGYVIRRLKGEDSLTIESEVAAHRKQLSHTVDSK